LPVYEYERKGWAWWQYVAVGCGGCALLGVIGSFAIGLFFTYTVRKAMTSPPPKSAPYHYNYWSQTATAKIALPGTYGTLVYGQRKPGAKGPAYLGRQGVVKVVQPNGGAREWPLMVSGGAKVEVYWHPAMSGMGPFVRLYDMGNESLLDLGRGEVGAAIRSGPTVMMMDTPYPGGKASGGSGGFSSPPGMRAPIDVTAALAAGNCTHLGAIVHSGGKPKYVPSGAKVTPQPAPRPKSNRPSYSL